MVTASRSEDGLVVRVEDGTFSQVVSVEYRGQDTNTQEEAGNNKHFIYVWVRNRSLVDRVREQEMVAGDWMKMDMDEHVEVTELETGDQEEHWDPLQGSSPVVISDDVIAPTKSVDPVSTVSTDTSSLVPIISPAWQTGGSLSCH